MADNKVDLAALRRKLKQQRGDELTSRDYEYLLDHMPGLPGRKVDPGHKHQAIAVLMALYKASGPAKANPVKKAAAHCGISRATAYKIRRQHPIGKPNIDAELFPVLITILEQATGVASRPPVVFTGGAEAFALGLVDLIIAEESK